MQLYVNMNVNMNYCHAVMRSGGQTCKMTILDKNDILLFIFMNNSQFLAHDSGFHRNSLEEFYSFHLFI